MGILDVNALMVEISPDNPVGENFEYDAAFGEIERAAEARPDQTLGDATITGVPADWKSVRSGAIELFAKTKDLRVAVLLTRALVNLQGWDGLQEGLALIRGLLETYWDTLHPELDPDDNNDPTLRINTLVTLCDRDATLNAVLAAPLVSVKGIGSFSLRDYKVANSELPVLASTEGATPDLGIIAGAFMECDINHVKELAASLSSCLEDIRAIDAYLMDQVGSASAPDLNALISTASDAHKLVNDNLARRGETVDTRTQETSENDSSTPSAISTAMPSGAIQSREDAARMMDKISEYFSKNEPSSPVPLLMQRAKRLSNLGFLEILKDLAPDGLTQAQNIGGVNSSKSD